MSDRDSTCGYDLDCGHEYCTSKDCPDYLVKPKKTVFTSLEVLEAVAQELQEKKLDDPVKENYIISVVASALRKLE